MKYLKKYNESEWYRGYTTNSKKRDFLWISSDKGQAKTYAKMNKIIQGGDYILSEYDLDLDKLNFLDLSDYDMNDNLKGFELENFLDEIDIEYDYENLFDFTEDEIPLSRLVNNITSDIMSNYDAMIIKEDGIDTMLIKKDKLSKN